jgi:PAS domain S-box-containing protein
MCQNPYYAPPDLVLDREAHLNKQVDWILSQLQHFQEQKQALAESEKSYRLLAENARDVVYQQRLVPEVSYDYVSPSITTITGYTPEDLYNDPGLMYKLVHPEDYHILETLKHSPDSFMGPVLLRWIHRDGTLHWVENNITPIYDKSENLIALEGIVRDVTERKRAEEEMVRQAEELLRSREQFRLLVEGVEDYAIFLLDPSGHISTWNSGAQQIKGYQAGEIIGQHFSCFYPEEDIAAGKPARLLRIAAAEGRVEDEGWRIRKDGTRFWADVIITALKDQEGQLWGFAKVTRDMTDRRKAEEERIKLLELAKEEEERQHLQALIDTSPVGVLVVNAPTRQVALVNPEMQRIGGFSYQPGKTLDECDQGLIYRKPDGQPYEPEDLPLRRALGHGETVRAEEVRIDFPDGTTISTLVNATPILDPGGQITSAIGIIQDLTPWRNWRSCGTSSWVW